MKAFQNEIPRRYQRVIEDIKNLVRKGELKPGDRFPPERELAIKFRVSRNVLREAFRVLESRGFVEGRRGGGRYLRNVNLSEMINIDNILIGIEKSTLLDIWEARQILETKIIELAIIRATDDDLQKIREIDRRVHDQFEKGIYIEQNDVDLEFHLAIAEASHNFVLKEIIRFQMTLLKEMRQNILLRSDYWKSLCEEHSKILEKILERNKAGAIQEMEKHLCLLRQGIIEIDAAGNI
jgi:GntR family transcriptional repressor for pyruvate dehydrogenase complex